MKLHVFLGFVALGFSQPAAGQLVIGTFDEARGGQGSLLSAAATVEQQAVLANYPCAIITASPSLTSAFLSGVDVLWLSVVFDGFTAISPLSTAEQSALSDYITAGGGALLFTDNNSQFVTTNQSFVNPFGLTTTGTLV